LIWSSKDLISSSVSPLCHSPIMLHQFGAEKRATLFVSVLL
jgi:hypothetical protein